MIIKTEEFKKILKTLKPALKDESMLVCDTESLILGIESVVIRYPFRFDKSFSVKANDIYEFFDSLKGGDTDIDINIDSENRLSFSNNKNTEAGFSIVDFDMSVYPLSPQKYNTLPKEFIDALRLCSFSAATDSTLGLLTCLNVTKGAIYSSDNFRVSKYVFAKPIKDEFLISLSVAKNLLKFTPVKLATDDNWLHFMLDSGAIFSCRKAMGTYPGVEDLLAVESENRFELPKELATAVKSVEFMSDSENVYERFVTVTMEKDKIVVSAENERGYVDFLINGEFPEFTFKIHPVFLYEILEKVNTITIGEDKALFEIDNFKHVMALPER